MLFCRDLSAFRRAFNKSHPDPFLGSFERGFKAEITLYQLQSSLHIVLFKELSSPFPKGLPLWQNRTPIKAKELKKDTSLRQGLLMVTLEMFQKVHFI